MNHLLEEYFKRDLTEAEEEQLAQWLSSSQENAQRFTALMETHYRGMGLSEPDWAEGPLPKFFPKAKSSPLWILLLVFFAFLLTVLASSSRFWRMKGQASPALGSSALSSPAADGAATSASLKKNPDLGRTAQRLAHPGAKPEGKVYDELSVVVDNPGAGLATVKVLDPNRSEIKILFAGILPAGQRTFTWDGKGENGLVSPPGLYYLEVTSGANVLRKEIHLGSDR